MCLPYIIASGEVIWIFCKIKSLNIFWHFKYKLITIHSIPRKSGTGSKGMDFRADWGVLVLLVVPYGWSFTNRSGETGLEKQAADHFTKILSNATGTEKN